MFGWCVTKDYFFLTRFLSNQGPLAGQAEVDKLPVSVSQRQSLRRERVSRTDSREKSIVLLGSIPTRVLLPARTSVQPSFIV